MERILVAVDFSEASRRALKAALELARAFNAKVRAVHVVSSALYGAGEEKTLFAQLRETVAGDADKALRDMVLEEFRGGTEDFDRIDRKILFGSAASAILEEAIWWDATLIVVGGIGNSAVRRLLLGSVASRILSRATIPVFVVHRDFRVRPRKVLAAVDRGPKTDDVLKVAAQWASKLGSELSVVHVVTDAPVPIAARLSPGGSAGPVWTRLMKEVERDVEVQVTKTLGDETRPAVHCRVGSAVDQICRCAEQGDFDLVVIGVHERNQLLDLSNTTARVAQHCPRSVLVARMLPPSEGNEELEDGDPGW